MHNLDTTDSSASVDTDGFRYESYGGDNDGWTQAKAKSWNSKADWFLGSGVDAARNGRLSPASPRSSC